MSARLARVGQGAFLLVLALFLAAPLVVVTGVSFNGNARMSFPPIEPGFRWYQVFLTDPGWLGSFVRSLAIAGLSALLALSIAIPIAYAQWRMKSRLARSLALLGSVPFLLPPVVVAVLFLLFWGTLRHVGQFENVVIAHGVTFAALPIVMVGLGFSSIDESLIEAARILGARHVDVLRTVVFPIAAPFIVSSFVFCAILSLNEYIIAYMVAGFTVETLPVKVFNNLRTGFTPAMCVGAVLFALVGLAGFALTARFGNLPKLLGGKG